MTSHQEQQESSIKSYLEAPKQYSRNSSGSAQKNQYYICLLIVWWHEYGTMNRCSYLVIFLLVNKRTFKNFHKERNIHQPFELFPISTTRLQHRNDSEIRPVNLPLPQSNHLQSKKRLFFICCIWSLIFVEHDLLLNLTTLALHEHVKLFQSYALYSHLKSFMAICVSISEEIICGNYVNWILKHLFYLHSTFCS